MSAWTISAIFTNVSTAWEHRFGSYQTGQGKDVRVLLQEIDEILRDTDNLLLKYEDLLTPGDYVWKWTKEKERLEETEDEALEPGRTPDQISAAKESSRTRTTGLLKTVKTHRSRVLQASYNASVVHQAAFPDEEPGQQDSPTSANTQTPLLAPEATVPSRTPTPRPPSPSRMPGIFVLPNNLGLMGRLKNLSDSNSRTRVRTTETTTENSTENTLVEGQSFGVVVAHIAVDPAQNIYRRQISVKHGNQQVHITDPELHVLEPGKADVDEETLNAICIHVAKSLVFQKSVEELQQEID